MWTRLVDCLRSWKRLSPASAFARALERQKRQRAEVMLGVLQAQLKRKRLEIARTKAETVCLRCVREALEMAYDLGDGNAAQLVRGRLRNALLAAAEVSRLSADGD